MTWINVSCYTFVPTAAATHGDRNCNRSNNTERKKESETGDAFAGILSVYVKVKTVVFNENDNGANK